MQDRLRKFLTQEGISPSQFADEIGVQRSAISHILSGRNYPSYEIIVKILNRYKRLSPDWLLLGNGSMYRSVEQTTLSIPDSAESISAPDISELRSNSDMSQLPSSSPIKDSNDSPAPVTNTIERIIFFYPDKSFDVYVPKH